ncbi:RNA polymerase sigma factor [Rothia uropygioeca]|uniref:RNA polymerase sigma factor n=1 Tax=Kocuria sp. 257 TaxID=2021970 RepID=UPI001012D05D|nr:sigma-70 family RNA polymerase sigma factor [Kocuria sp. 257]
MKQKTPFEAIVQRHGPTVWRMCRAVLGAGPDAEDAWAETFVAVLEGWDALAEDTNVEAWLVRVAQRKSIDVLRSAARRAEPMASTPEATSPHNTAVGPETAPDPADLALARERNAMVWKAVDDLPERQRLAVAYHHLGGLPHDEVARVIGGTPEAVRRASSDGIRKLRLRILSRDGDGPVPQE